MRNGPDHQRLNAGRQIQAHGIDHKRQEEDRQRPNEPSNTIISPKESKWKKLRARLFGKKKN